MVCLLSNQFGLILLPDGIPVNSADPPWWWRFNTGKETAHFLVHHNRPYQENMGFLMVQHGEDADY